MPNLPIDPSPDDRTRYGHRTVIGEIDGVPQLGDDFDGPGRVHDAVRLIIDICPAGANTADEISRARAAATLDVLDLDLTPREHMAVLRRFPELVAGDEDQRPCITAEANPPAGLVHVRRDDREVLVVTVPEARQLVAEVAAALGPFGDDTEGHARLVAALVRQGERARAAGYTTCPACCATGPADTLGMSDRGGLLRVPLCSWCSGEVLASPTSTASRRWLR
jgi:hypothetical protein